MQRLAVLSYSPKGGVGKSTFSRGLLDLFRVQQNLTTAGFDCDTHERSKNESLLSYYGQRDAEGALITPQDPLKGVVPVAIRDDRKSDYLVNLLGDVQADRYVIDLPAGAGYEIEKILGDVNRFFSAYEAMGIKPVLAIVTDHIKASVRGVIETLQTFGPVPHYIVVKNLGKASDEDFDLFDGPPTNSDPMDIIPGLARKLLLDVGGEIFNMPPINEGTYGRIDRHHLKWAEALRSPQLTPVDRIRAVDFRKSFAQAADQTILGQVSGVPAVL